MFFIRLTSKTFKRPNSNLKIKFIIDYKPSLDFRFFLSHGLRLVEPNLTQTIPTPAYSKQSCKIGSLGKELTCIQDSEFNSCCQHDDLFNG